MKKVLILLLSICSISFVLSSNIKVKADVIPIYYISDNVNCYTFKNEIVLNTNYTSNDITVFDCSNVSYGFYSQFSNYYSTLYAIEDSYVIFEISHGFDNFIVNDNIYFVDELCVLFEEMKNNGCEIMFISGTDECKYYDQNDLLDYVDFHIITDIKHIFTMNFFYYLEENCDCPPSNADIILSNDYLNLFSGYYNSPGNSGFRNTYLLPYVNSRFGDYILDNHTQAEALMESELYFYAEVYGAYHSIDGHLNYTFGLDSFVPVEECYCVGANNSSSSVSDIWLGIVDALTPEYLFYYEGYQQNSLSLHSFSYTDDYACTPIYNNPSILTMTIDFLNCGQNYYGVYDNWVGDCDVTHAMFGDNPSGWMLSFAHDGDIYFNCWNLYYNYESGNEIGCAYYDDNSMY